ncbi:VanZ family protein [Arthrobacter sp. D3-18]
MALPTKPWWHVAAIGLLASLCMEFGQLIFISARFSSLVDIVTNACGAVLGIALARLLCSHRSLKLAKA